MSAAAPAVKAVRKRLGIVVAGVMVAALLPLVVAQPASAATYGESEPNNSRSTADAVAVGDTITGATSAGTSSDHDYFAVSVPSAGRLTLNVTFPSGLGAGDAYDVDVYDASGSQLFHFDVTGDKSDGSWLAAHSTFVPAGQIYVRIYGQSNWQSWGKQYALTPGFAAGNVEREFNASRSTATVVATGAPISGSTLMASTSDYDYYAVDLPSAGRVSLNLSFASGWGSGDVYDVDVYNSSGSQLYHFDITGDKNSGTWLADHATYAPAGRLYVRVYGQSNWVSWGKTYTLTAGFAAGSVENEFNASRSTATVIAAGATVSGSSLMDGSSDYDYYAVDLPSPGRVALNLKFPSTLGAGDVYDVDVYDASGSQLYHFDVTGNRSSGAWLSSHATYAPAGRLYVRIYGQRSWASWGKTYTLNAGFTAGAVETEFNAARSTANVLTIGKATTGSALMASSHDYDYFAIDLSTARTVALKLTYPSGLGAGNAYTVTVYSASGATLSSTSLTGAHYSGNALLAKTINLPAGRSYVSIYGQSGWTTWGKPYAITALYALTKTPTPTIAGTVKVGSTLTAKPGTWAPAPVTMTYQWLRGGKAISGATKSTYKLVTADAGTKITVAVTGTKSAYKSVAKTSAAKSVPLLKLTTTPTPTISGTAAVGKTLTAKPGTWAPATVTIKYQWLRGGKAISGATKSTYKVVSADKGKKITVKVTGSKKSYKSVSKVSAAKTIK